MFKTASMIVIPRTIVKALFSSGHITICNLGQVCAVHWEYIKELLTCNNTILLIIIIIISLIHSISTDNNIIHVYTQYDLLPTMVIHAPSG